MRASITPYWRCRVDQTLSTGRSSDCGGIGPRKLRDAAVEDAICIHLLLLTINFDTGIPPGRIICHHGVDTHRLESPMSAERYGDGLDRSECATDTAFSVRWKCDALPVAACTPGSSALLTQELSVSTLCLSIVTGFLTACCSITVDLGISYPTIHAAVQYDTVDGVISEQTL